MKQYLELAQHVRKNGVFKADRTGTGTYSVFGAQMRFSLRDHKLPVITTKQTALKSIIHELLWFLKGDSNMRYLANHGVTIWDKNAIKQGKDQEYADYTSVNRAKKHCKSQEQLVDFFNALDDYVSPEERDGWVQVQGLPQWTHPDIEEIAHAWLDQHGVRGGRQELVAADLGPIYGVQWRSWTTAAREPLSMTERGKALAELLKENNINPADVEAVRQFIVDYTLRDGFELPFWRNKTIDQIAKTIEQLRTNPDDRRIIVSAWNVADLDDMAIPPCHAMFQFYSAPLSSEKITAAINNRRGVYEEIVEALKAKYGETWGDSVFGVWSSNHDDYGSYPFVDELKAAGTEGADLIGQDRETYLGMNQIVTDICQKYRIPVRELSCQLYQRSADVLLGVPFNITSYALLTKMIAHVTNHAGGEFIWTGGDVHIYRDHLEQIDVQLTREPYEAPVLFLNDAVREIDQFQYADFEIVDYKHHPAIAANMSA